MIIDIENKPCFIMFELKHTKDSLMLYYYGYDYYVGILKNKMIELAFNREENTFCCYHFNGMNKRRKKKKIDKTKLKNLLLNSRRVDYYKIII